MPFTHASRSYAAVLLGLSLGSTASYADSKSPPPYPNGEVIIRVPYPINDLGYFRTEDVYPDPQGELNIILAPEYHQDSGDGDFVLPFQLEYGITNQWLLNVSYEVYSSHQINSREATHGTGDLDIFSKYSFLNIGGSNTNAALGFNLHIPTGDISKDTTDGFLRYEPAVIISQDFPGTRWVHQLFGDFGFSFVSRIKHHADPEDDEPAAHSIFINGGYVLRTLRINYLVELNWENNEWNNGGTDNILAITPGIFASATEQLEIGFAVSAGLTSDADDFRLLSQFIYAIQLVNY